jgi:hypothetical protein
MVSAIRKQRAERRRFNAVVRITLGAVVWKEDVVKAEVELLRNEEV